MCKGADMQKAFKLLMATLFAATAASSATRDMDVDKSGGQIHFAEY